MYPTQLQLPSNSDFDIRKLDKTGDILHIITERKDHVGKRTVPILESRIDIFEHVQIRANTLAKPPSVRSLALKSHWIRRVP